MIRQLFAIGIFVSYNLFSTTYNVSNTSASGANSLVAAAISANSGSDSIIFIAGSSGTTTLVAPNVCTIQANLTLSNNSGGAVTLSPSTTGLFTVSGNVSSFTIGTSTLNPALTINTPINFISATTTTAAKFVINTPSLTFGTSTSQLDLGSNWGVQFNYPMTVGGGIVLNGSSANPISVNSSTDTVTISGVVSSRGFIKTGAGVLYLSNPNNTYTSATQVDQGTLSMAALGSMGPNRALIVNGGTLNLANVLTTGATFTLSGTGGGILYFGGMNLTLTSPTSTTLSYDGTLAGTGSVTKTGPGTLVLGGVSSYTTATNVLEGVLSITGSGSLTASSGVVINNGATLAINVSSSTTVKAISGGGSISLLGGTLIVSSTGTIAFEGPVSGSGGFTKTGTGTLVLSNTTDYSGPTNIGNGTLLITGSGALTNSSQVTVTNAGAILNIGNSSGSIVTLNLLQGGGGGVVDFGSKTMHLKNTSTSTFSGGIQGSSGILIKTGTGTFIFNGSFSGVGSFTVQEGTCVMEGDNSSFSGSTTIATDATLSLSGSGALNVSPMSIQGTFDIAGARPSGAVVIGGLAGSGTVILGNNNLQLNTALRGNFQGTISGAGGFIKTGSGSLNYAGVGDYAGGTTVSGGKLVIIDSGSLGSGTVTMGTRGSIDISGADGEITLESLNGRGNLQLGGNTLILNNPRGGSSQFSGSVGDNDEGGSIIKIGTDDLLLDGSLQYLGTTTIEGGNLIIGQSSSLEFSSSILLNGGSLDVTSLPLVTLQNLSGNSADSYIYFASDMTIQQDRDADFMGILSGTGTVYKNGSNLLNLFNVQQGTDTLNIDTGTLALVDTGDISSFSEVIINGDLDISAVSAPTQVVSLSGGGNLIIGSSQLIVALPDGVDNDFTGLITGDANSQFTIAGVGGGSGGVLHLDSDQSFGGQVNVSVGTLQLRGSAALNNIVGIDVEGVVDTNGTGLSEIFLNNLSGSSGFVDSSSVDLYLYVSPNYTSQYDGQISTPSLYKVGDGTQNLGSSQNYDNITEIHISEGTLALWGDGALTGPNFVAIGSGATFDISNIPGSSTSVSALIGEGMIYLGDKDLTINNISPASTYYGVISGTGSLTLDVSTSAIFSLIAAQEYTGPTNLLGGIFSLSGPNASISSSGAVIFAGGTFDLQQKTTDTIVQNIQGSGAITLGSNLLTVANNTPTSFHGSITGSGGFAVSGTSMLSLTDVSYYTGATIVENGATLDLQSIIDPSSSCQVDGFLMLENNPFPDVLLHNLSGFGEISGLGNTGPQNLQLEISGSSGYSGTILTVDPAQSTLSITGGGRFMVDGNLSFEGVIAVNDGTLEVTGGGSIADAAGVNLFYNSTFLDISNADDTVLVKNIAGSGDVILGSNTLQFFTNDTNVFQGVISGSGGVQFIGGATTTISRNLPYTGPTLIESGLRLTSNASIAASSSVEINGTLNASFVSTAILQNVTGTGVINTGTSSTSITFHMTTAQDFSGTCIGSGNTYVMGGGSLNLVQDQSYSGQMSVDGGLLGLNAVIPAMDIRVNSSGKLFGNGTARNLVNNGLIAPGNSIGTIVLTGNYTQVSGATLDMEIHPSGASDLITATGTATIGSGAIMQITAFPGFYEEGLTFTLLTAQNGVSGTFLLNDLSSTGFSLFQDVNNVFLGTQQNTFVIPVPVNELIGYAHEMAVSLFCPEVPGIGDMLETKIALVQLEPDLFIDALSRLMPSQMTGLAIVQIENNNRTIGLLQNRIQRLRKEVECVDSSLPEYTAWITPTTFWLRQEDMNGSRPFKSNTSGVNFGAEKFFKESVFGGFGVGYSYSHTHWFEDLGNAYTNEIYFGPYASVEWKKFYLSTSVMGSYETTSMNRVLSFTNFYRTATSRVQGWNLTNMFDVKRYIDLTRCFYLLPEISMTFSQLWRQHTAESGGMSLDMEYPSQFNSTMRTVLNLSGGARVCLNQNMAIDGRIQVGYMNTNLWTSNELKAYFIATNQVCDPLLEINGSLPSINQGVVGCAINANRNEFGKLEFRANYTFGGHSSVAEIELGLEASF